MTATSCWTVKDGTRHPTGHWAEEFAAPCSALTATAHEIVVATPGGIVPYVDAELAPRNGVSPFGGYRLTAHTNDEGDAVGLHEKAPRTARRRTGQVGGEEILTMLSVVVQETAFGRFM